LRLKVGSLRCLSAQDITAHVHPGTSHGQQKNHIRSRKRVRFEWKMKKITRVPSVNARPVDQIAAAMELLHHYCEAHPGSPAAVRRPQLFIRSGVWIALLGPSVEDGIVGIGATVEAALRAFDTQYLAGLRPPDGIRRRLRRRFSSKKSAASCPPLQG
jgi:hypothetical protein